MRGTEQRVDSWRLCSASYQYPGSVNEALQRSSSPLDTQYASKAISESPLRVHTHMHTHADLTYTAHVQIDVEMGKNICKSAKYGCNQSFPPKGLSTPFKCPLIFLD